MTFEKTSSTLRMALGATALTLIGSAAQADFVIADDLIVDGSACIGFDCVNGESFGFDTLRLKENNLRINFADTSTSASFPTRDWRIVANDTSNGGDNYLAFEDTDASTQPFIVDAGAGSNALNVSSSGGNVGMGTGTPVVELHIVDGDTPTIRLEQNGSSGFTTQTWDIAGNETNFFVRDVSNGSLLPFRIKPNSPGNSIFVEATTGDVSFQAGTNPTSALHVQRTNGTAQLHVDENSATQTQRDLIVLTNRGDPGINMTNEANGNTWRMRAGGGLILDHSADGTFEFNLASTGNLTILGTLTENSDKHNKMAIEPVDTTEILAKVAALPVSTWTYKHDAEAGTRHIGPMAQDFYALFGTGATDKGISTLDTSGVALAAIKALSAENEAQKALIADLSARLERLENAD